jgi:hypothetical protein
MATLQALDGNLTTRYYLRRSTFELQKYSIGPFFYQLNRFAKKRIMGDDTAPLWAHTRSV